MHKQLCILSMFGVPKLSLATTPKRMERLLVCIYGIPRTRWKKLKSLERSVPISLLGGIDRFGQKPLVFFVPSKKVGGD